MSGYTQAWLLILAMCLGGGLVLYRLVRGIPWLSLRWSIVLGTVMLLATPAPVPGYSGHFAPAIIVGVFEAFFQTDGDPTLAFILLGAGLAVAVIVSVIISLLLKRTMLREASK